MSSSISQRLAEFRRASGLDALLDMAQFCRVQSVTALTWLEGGSLPKGETLIRLQYYLQLNGLTLSELDELPLPAYELGESIALDLVSIADVVSILGYTQSNTNGLYRLLQGNGAFADKLEKMEALVKRLAPSRSAARAQFIASHDPWAITRDGSSVDVAPASVPVADAFEINAALQGAALALGSLVRLNGVELDGQPVSFDNRSREVLSTLLRQLTEISS